MSAMTYNQLMLIEAIIKNDMPQARSWARACVAEDTTKKNASKLNYLAKQLDPKLNPSLEALPAKMMGKIEFEKPADTFNVQRYWLSPREADLWVDIDRMRKVCDELAAIGISRANTVLLYGASGTGKTTFGRFVAAAYDLPFFYVNFSRLIDSLMGKTAQNLASVFDYIRTVPCVFMLDEIDTVSTQRIGNTDSAGGELNRVTVTLMQEFDKLTGTQIVLAATNRLDIIDRALLRRFTRVHEVIAPIDADEAAKVITILLDDCQIGYDRNEVVSWCAMHPGRPQSWLINQTIDRIAELICHRQVLQESGNVDLAPDNVLHFGSAKDVAE